MSIHPPVAYDMRVGLREVYFTPAGGGEGEFSAVTRTWEPIGNSLPLVNLENGETSVPHKSAVRGADGYFWTFTRFGDECQYYVPGQGRPA